MFAASRRASAVIAISFLMALAGIVPSGNARVGVTSETNGDPLGKPPAEAERVLRMGLDIQPDELITTRAGDRAHIVFLDGTSLTVSPNSQIKVDRFVYDPQARTGEIAMTVTRGVFRLVGGKISKNTPVSVTTPSATIGIRGGIGLFTVDPDRTTAQFLFGTSMRVTARGQSQTAVRAGSEIHTSLGGAPSEPGLISPGSLSRALQALEGQRASSAPSGGQATTPDEAAKRSGFSDQNSGRAVGGPPPGGRVESLSRSINSNLQLSRPVTLPATIVPTAPALPPAPSATPLPEPPQPPSHHRRHHHHHGHRHHGHGHHGHGHHHAPAGGR